jgi:hypothetical protein
MDAVFGRHFVPDAATAETQYRRLRARGDVLAGNALRGPAEKYAISELWNHVYYMWTERSGSDVFLNLMAGDKGAFDPLKALDVVMAFNDTFSDVRCTTPTITRHLFAFIQRSPYAAD